MRIKASVGRAPASASLDDTVYSLSLTATTEGEKRFLARLLKAVKGLDIEWLSRLRKKYPSLTIKEVHHGSH
jgi:hypothetical protein